MNPPSHNPHLAAPRSPAPPHPSPPPQPPPHSHPSHSTYPSHHLSNPSPRNQSSYDKRYANDTHQYDRLPPQDFQRMPRANHLHLPGVNTYIEHYHYYNFNGNCTVQQAASSDGQQNTIRMVSSNRHNTNLHAQNMHDIPPPHQPVSSSPHAAPESRRHHPHQNHDHYPRDPPRHHSSLPQSHLAPLANSHPMSTSVPHLPPHTSLLNASSRFSNQPPPIPDPPHIPPQPPILPRFRASDQEPPILAPLQNSVPTSLSPLHAEEKLSDRPAKKSRISRGPLNSLAPHDSSNALPCAAAPAAGSESQSAAEDRVTALPRGSPYGISERAVATTNSSSPSPSDYPVVARTDGFERNNGSAGNARVVKSADESQSNDWEAVVEMYTTGKGTEDGVALKLITKGDGRRVSDRKLLEKRRTIGKTYECLGVERFERAIGYKWENGVRRKQKMYHVISRCRVVNAMRKAGESIPTGCEELTRLINGRIAEKEAVKAGMARRGSAGGSGVGSGRLDGGSGVGGLGGGMGHSLEDSGRLRGLGHHVRDGHGTGGELGGLRGGRLEHERDVSGRGSLGHGRSNATNGYGDGGLAGRDEDEIRPGRARDGGRYA